MNQEKIGKLIAKLRKSKGLTQSELGDMVGVGFRAVSKWENGITVPDISIINDLSKILGISADELLKGELNKANQNKSSFNIKKLLYIIPIILVFVLFITLININKNKTEVYKLAVVDADSDNYYIDGKIIFEKNNITIDISKLIFHRSKLNETIIKNYQYELYSGDILIIGCGYTATNTNFIDSPTSINKLLETFKINYVSKELNKKSKMIINGITLKLGFIDEYNNEIKKEIQINLVKQK